MTAIITTWKSDFNIIILNQQPFRKIHFHKKYFSGGRKQVHHLFLYSNISVLYKGTLSI